MLVAAAEVVDAVVLRERVGTRIGDAVIGIDAVHRAALRPWALYRRDAYTWDAATDTIRPNRGGRLAKLIDTNGVADLTDHPRLLQPTRRGPYLADDDLGPVASMALRDASLLGRGADRRRPSGRPGHGPLSRPRRRRTDPPRHHGRRSAAAFGSPWSPWPPTAASLGDRRPDFLDITPRIFCLGDLVHPDAMVGIIEAILDATGAEIIYNANGTTLFYDFAPRLKANRPNLRIIDHLYDHRIGYIDSYVPGVEDAVDVCVAENGPIADVLVRERGWPENRVPVIWPCGRPDEALPPEDQRDRLRDSIRDELGFDRRRCRLSYRRSDAPAETTPRSGRAGRAGSRSRDGPLLIVGGGDLENEVDAAIDRPHGVRIRRLGFRTDIPDLILAADIGCLVSEHEGLPVFMLECLQLGRPFLGTRVGDLGHRPRRDRRRARGRSTRRSRRPRGGGSHRSRDSGTRSETRRNGRRPPHRGSRSQSAPTPTRASFSGTSDVAARTLRSRLQGSFWELSPPVRRHLRGLRRSALACHSTGSVGWPRPAPAHGSPRCAPRNADARDLRPGRHGHRRGRGRRRRVSSPTGVVSTNSLRTTSKPC